MNISISAATDYANAIFCAAGMDAEKAKTVADLLVLTDCLGRRTHGLAMAVSYLNDIEKCNLQLTGQPEVLKDTGATLVWDGNYLPGLWLVKKAIDIAALRAQQFGVMTVAIARSHHIGCLAALTKIAADQGLIAIIANSDPSGKRVAPFGGRQALFTPNPFAIGYPGADHPVLVDICASITTTSMTRDKFAAGEQFEFPWLLDAAGEPTCDPAVLENTHPRGSLQLLGGQEYGHKGFGLALIVEALSQGLSGHGRKDQPTRWGGNVFLQIINPEFFAGLEGFVEQTDFLSKKSRENPPIDEAKPVRVPGDQAQASLLAARKNGLRYEQNIIEILDTWVIKRGLTRDFSSYALQKT
jgi:LDH2 family malate/lactate/ureidoglycolate dehydrogenase